MRQWFFISRHFDLAVLTKDGNIFYWIFDESVENETEKSVFYGLSFSSGGDGTDTIFLGFDEAGDPIFNSEEDKIFLRLKKVIELCKNNTVKIPSMKDLNWNKVKIECELVNNVCNRISTEDITSTNTLICASAIVICEWLGKIVFDNNRKRKKSVDKEPWWKRRLTRSIIEWRKDLSKLEEYSEVSEYSEITNFLNGTEQDVTEIMNWTKKDTIT